MTQTITRADMTAQVTAAIEGFIADFDVEAIVDEIHRDHGLIDIEGLSHAEFWAVVQRHDVAAPPVIEPELYSGYPSRFYLTSGGVERQVTKAEWVAAERSAGFRGGRDGEPSTGGFGNGYVSGSIRMVMEPGSD